MINPNRNQKVVGVDEREKMKEGTKKQKEKNEIDKIAIKNAEKEIFERDKANLPTILKERMMSLELALEQGLEGNGLTSARIHQLISRQTYYSGNNMIGYSPKELFIVYQAYTEMIDKINQYKLFVPSIKNFCAYAGFSSNTFENYLQSPDDEKRNVAKMIEDYISDMITDASKMRKTDNATSIYELKSVHKQVEATNPITINHTNQMNVSDILSRVEAIKKGQVIEGEFKEKD
jgi:hypothetical protein